MAEYVEKVTKGMGERVRESVNCSRIESIKRLANLIVETGMEESGPAATTQ